MKYLNPLKIIVLPKDPAAAQCVHLAEVDPRDRGRVLRFVRQRPAALKAALAQWSREPGDEGARQRSLIEGQLRRRALRTFRLGR